jgi:DNA-binding transcriptional LysR family regulator
MRVTRSAVGKSIGRLEHSLGVRLFHRTTRRLNLTEDGQVFYERCVRALAEIDAAEAALDNGRRAPVGRLRVSVPYSSVGIAWPRSFRNSHTNTVG